MGAIWDHDLFSLIKEFKKGSQKAILLAFKRETQRETSGNNQHLPRQRTEEKIRFRMHLILN